MTGNLKPRVSHASIVPTDSLFQQFAEFLHLASATICEEAGPVGVPFVVVNPANPVCIRVVERDILRLEFSTAELSRMTGCLETQTTRVPRTQESRRQRANGPKIPFAS